EVGVVLRIRRRPGARAAPIGPGGRALDEDGEADPVLRGLLDVIVAERRPVVGRVVGVPGIRRPRHGDHVPRDLELVVGGPELLVDREGRAGIRSDGAVHVAHRERRWTPDRFLGGLCRRGSGKEKCGREAEEDDEPTHAVEEHRGRPGVAVQVAILLHKTVVHDGRVLREAGALADAGHDVVVVHLPSGGEKEGSGGFRLRSATPPRWTRRLPRSLWRIVALGSIALGARAERPDVVHANDIATLIPGYFAARLSGAKLVYDTHEYAVGVPYRKAVWAWLAATIERLLIGRCDAVITVSDGIAERLESR